MITKRAIFVGLAILTVGSAAALVTGRAQAVFDTYGRSYNYGYYSNSTMTGLWNDYVFTYSSDPKTNYMGISKDWDTVPMTQATFITEMQNRLNSPVDYNAARASAIINMMMGIDADDPRYKTPDPVPWKNGVAVAQKNFVTWTKIIQAYDSAGRIKWDDLTVAGLQDDWLGQTKNNSLTDIPGRQLPDMVPTTLATTQPAEAAIVFYALDGTPQFTIKKKCANLTGNISPLDVTIIDPPPPPPPPLPPPPPPEPYFEVKGGDVMTGISMATEAADGTKTACSLAKHIDEAGVVSWNKDGSPDYSGAGDEYATYARGYVQDFVTGTGTGVSDKNDASSLTFANADSVGSVDPDNGLFGGMFGSAACVDYWSGRPSALVPIPAGSAAGWAGGTYYVSSGNVTLSAASLPNGKNITLYVNGNVAINGNITYSGLYSNRAEIPSFRLIVHGSIFIGANVTKLDGVYIAIPDNASNGATYGNNYWASVQAGTISTCSIGFKSYNPRYVVAIGTTPPNDMAAKCAAPLTVTGSVIARQVWMLRTGGSLQAGGPPAEVFQYSPEVWMSQSGAASGASATPDYQSIIGLPPIL